jgi:hypothetical protein
MTVGSPAATFVAIVLAVLAAAPATAAEYFCSPTGTVLWRDGVPVAEAPADYAEDELGTLGFWLVTDTGEYGERLGRNRAGISLEAMLDMVTAGSAPGTGTENLLGVDRASGLVVRIDTWIEGMPFIRVGPHGDLLVGTCGVSS